VFLNKPAFPSVFQSHREFPICIAISFRKILRWSTRGVHYDSLQLAQSDVKENATMYSSTACSKALSRRDLDGWNFCPPGRRVRRRYRLFEMAIDEDAWDVLQQRILCSQRETMLKAEQAHVRESRISFFDRLLQIPQVHRLRLRDRQLRCCYAGSHQKTMPCSKGPTLGMTAKLSDIAMWHS